MNNFFKKLILNNILLLHTCLTHIVCHVKLINFINGNIIFIYIILE